MTECASHELFSSYPVMFAARGAIVAHFRCTVLLLPSGTSKVRERSLAALILGPRERDSPDGEAAENASKKGSHSVLTSLIGQRPSNTDLFVFSRTLLPSALGSF